MNIMESKGYVKLYPFFEVTIIKTIVYIPYKMTFRRTLVSYHIDRLFTACAIGS